MNEPVVIGVFAVCLNPFLFFLPFYFLVSHGVVGYSLFNNYIVQFQKRSSSVLLSKYGGVARGGPGVPVTPPW